MDHEDLSRLVEGFKEAVEMIENAQENKKKAEEMTKMGRGMKEKKTEN